MLKRWFVITPEVSYVDVIVDGQGPTYYESDVIEIEAETARDAIKFGVKEMLKNWRFRYCKDRQLEGLCPYTGVKAKPCLEEKTNGNQPTRVKESTFQA